jgi:hypothetical protein
MDLPRQSSNRVAIRLGLIERNVPGIPRFEGLLVQVLEKSFEKLVVFRRKRHSTYSVAPNPTIREITRR